MSARENQSYAAIDAAMQSVPPTFPPLEDVGPEQSDKVLLVAGSSLKPMPESHRV